MPDVPPIPFHPVGADFPGWPMPASVPPGLRMELSRARLLEGREAGFDDWMRMLHDRHAEAVATLPKEQMAFEATFLNQEADGSWWMYHLQVMGEGSPGLDLSDETGTDLDREHHRFAVATKHAGWEELRPRLFLAPDAVRTAMVAAARPRRSRQASRVLVTHRGRTLLFRDTDPGVPGSSWWTTPGGGLDPGETWLDAAVREVHEETGFEVSARDLVGPIAHRTVTHGYSDRVTTQEEMFYRMEVTDAQADAGISTAGHTASERQRIVESAWLSPADLTGRTVWPPEVAELLDADPAAGVRELGQVEESTVAAAG